MPEKTSSTITRLVACVVVQSVITAALCCTLVVVLLKLDHVQHVLDDLGLSTKGFTDSLYTNDTDIAGSKGDKYRSKFKRRTNFCGGEVLIGQEEIFISSPNYPNSYPVNTVCDWTIRPRSYPEPSAYERAILTVHVSFDGAIDIEAARNCRFDRLEFRGGSENGPLLGSYCGRNFTVDDFISFRGPIHVKFISDRSVTGGGFKLAVTTREAFPAPPGAGEEIDAAGHSTYYAWGINFCPDGISYYQGSAMAYERGSPDISCVPDHLDMNATSPSITSARGNVMKVLQFGKLTRGIIDADLDGKRVDCSLCHVNRAETFTVLGWSDCHGGDNWSTVYSGYLMSTSGDGVTSSSAICVDSQPTLYISQGSSRGLKLDYISTGEGFYYNDKAIPCAVCVKAYVPL